MLEIATFNETTQALEEYTPVIELVFKTAVSSLNLDLNSEVNVIFVTPERIKEMNQNFRQKATVTDVISFALQDETQEEPLVQEQMVPLPLGDIFICYDRAARQSVEYGHTIKREVAFLACHGLLHLLGYSHQTKAEEDEMFSKQEMILSVAGINREGKSKS